MLRTAVFTIATSLVAMNASDRADWANHQMVAHQLPASAKAMPVNHGERFFDEMRGGRNHFVASGGTYLETAGSGSTWVYDPAHHIIALSEHGDVTGDQMWYSESPPFPIVQRDLSAIASPHGLRLGMSVSAALTVLRLTPSAVATLPNGHRYISTSHVVEVLKNGNGAERVRDNNLVFVNDRAIWIDLTDTCC